MRSSRTLSASCTLGTSRTLSANITLRTLSTNRTLRTLSTRQALGTSRTLRSSRTLNTLRSLRTLSTNLTLRPLRTDSTLRTLSALSTLGTLRAFDRPNIVPLEVHRIPDVQVAVNQISVTRIPGRMGCNQLRKRIERTKNRDAGTRRTLRTSRTLRADRTNLRVHHLHHRDNQRRCIHRHTVSDSMLNVNVGVRRPVSQLEIVAGSQRQQEIPSGNLIRVFWNDQFRCRVRNRRPVFHQPNVDLGAVTATSTMMQLRRELQIVCAVISERDPRPGCDRHTVRLSSVIECHQCAGVNHRRMLILIREKRAVIAERSGSTRSNNSHLIRGLLNNNRVRYLVNNNLIDSRLNNDVIRSIIDINCHRVTSGVTLKEPCNRRVTTPFEATISKS